MQLTLSLVTRNRANNTLILKMTIHQKTSKTFWIMRQKRKYHKMPPNADYFATKIKKERKKSRTPPPKKKEGKKNNNKKLNHTKRMSQPNDIRCWYMYCFLHFLQLANHYAYLLACYIKLFFFKKQFLHPKFNMEKNKTLPKQEQYK